MEFQADSAAARANMVEGQLRPNRITDKALLARMAALPRELFVTPEAKPTAYVDGAQPMGQGREMLGPMVLARLIQGLGATADDTVLVAAGGTGYSAAVLSALAAKVVLVEDNAKLAAQAEKLIAKLDLSNVQLLRQPPEKGAPRNAPFACILVDAPAEHIPPALIAQLREGGRLAAVRSGADGVLEASVATKHGGTLFEEPLFETKGHILPAFATAETFVF